MLVGLLEQRRFGSLAAVALCLAGRRRRFVQLGSGGASARSAAAAILLARRQRRCSLGGGGAGLPGGGGASIRSAAARTVCGGGIALLLSPTFAFRVWLLVLWDDRNGCSGQQSRLSESARAQGFPIPADNFPNELVARV